MTDQVQLDFKDFFQAVGWQVEILKYGKLLEAAFKKPGGDALRTWIDECPNELYSALTFKGGAAFRERLEAELADVKGIRELLDAHDDDALHRLMTNLAGHDMEAVLDGFQNVDDSVPHCFIVYTVKGFGLPFAGHKDNHAGLMNTEQMAAFKQSMNI